MKKKEFKQVLASLPTYKEIVKEVARRSKKEKFSISLLLDEMWISYKAKICNEK